MHDAMKIKTYGTVNLKSIAMSAKHGGILHNCDHNGDCILCID